MNDHFLNLNHYSLTKKDLSEVGFEPTNPDDSRAAQPICLVRMFPSMGEERPLKESGALDRSATPTC